MADLSYAEKAVLEKLIEGPNGNGYVLDFSDQSFHQFVGDSVGIDIDDEKYRQFGNSKAKRLRTFISLESNTTVSKLLLSIVEYRKVFLKPLDPSTYTDASKIIERLRGGNVIEEVYDIQAINDEKQFDRLAKSIIDHVEKDNPEESLDRLHTFAVKFFRTLCDKHQIEFNQSESLNSIYGKYIKHLKNKKLLESVMAEKILVYSMEVISAFNAVRNDKSFAHDNPLLNYDESVLIVKNVANTIGFIRKIEERNDATIKFQKKEDKKDFPF